MKLGLIGLPRCGKTTIFNALTGLNLDTNSYSSSNEPNQAVIKVQDERVLQLEKMYQPKKTVFATIEVIDMVSNSTSKENLFSVSSMQMIRNVDAIAMVIANFPDELGQAPKVEKDINDILSELVLNDLIIVENRLEKIQLAYKRGQKTNELKLEEEVLNKIKVALEEDILAKDLSLEEKELKAIRGFQLMTLKPILTILNSDEKSYGKNQKLLESIKNNAIEFAGKFEMDLVSLEEEEKKFFMEELQIKESAYAKLTNFAYAVLGYISFFTVGSDEVRAWTIDKNSTAIEAAGAIHSDLARGFIRAECFNYEDLIKYEKEKVLREKGLFRLEGKEYIVQDGDILNIRFNV